MGPVSATPLALRAPRGEEELALLQSLAPAPQTMLELAKALASAPDGEPIVWSQLPAAELGAVALLVRRAWLGDRIHTEGACVAPGCGAAIDVVFSIGDYLQHHRPRSYRGCQPVGDGWLTLSDSEFAFRIPTIGDLLAGDDLMARCVRPADPPARVARRIDRALEALAPRLDGEVQGSCPECGATVALLFDPVAYVVAELRAAASGLYEEVHELARAYHWSEREILALDRERRRRYVTLVREELVLA